MDRIFLLIGGNGFLGKGLQDKLNNKNIKYKIFDKTITPIQDLLIYNESQLQYFQDITDIVILASNIGINIFNNNPIKYGLENIKIIENIYKLIVESAKKYKQSYNITFYSTSEVYQNKTYINLNYSDARSLYAQSKLIGETIFNDLHIKHPEICKSIKILRPFNISGKGQKRGVVYDMISDAFNLNIIKYSENTYRIITDIEYASYETLNVILNENSLIKNIVRPDMYLSMYELAIYIKNILEEHTNLKQIKLVKTEQDKFISNRIINFYNTANSNIVKQILTNIIKDICLDEYKYFK